MVVSNISKEVENVLTGHWIIEWHVTIPNVVIQPFFSVAFSLFEFYRKRTFGIPIGIIRFECSLFSIFMERDCKIERLVFFDI